MSPATGLTIQLALLLMLCAVVVTLKAIELYRRLQDLAAPPAAPQPAPPPLDLASVDATPLAGAGAALATPPNDLAVSLAYLQAQYPHRRFTLPLGWQQVNGAPVCVVAHLVDDVYHLLLTAKSRVGKDNAALTWLLSLALTSPPTRLQVAILDGKGGLDWAGWQGKAHTWRLAIDRDALGPAMEALTQERERRAMRLRGAGVSAWEGYPGDDLPLLVIYVSELLLLQDATSPRELERWLNSELSASGAFGMRYLVATQTASNFSTRWRGQVDLCVAGFQPSASQDQPNTGLTTAEITAAGALPPSALPAIPHGRGVFTLVQGRQAETVRLGYLDDAQRRRWLAQLPQALGSAAPAPAGGVGAIPPHADAQAAPAPGALHDRPAPMVARAPGLAVDGDRSVTAQPAAERVVWEAGTGRDPGTHQPGADRLAASAHPLSDDEIQALLLANTPVRTIATRLRGRMQKRLERIATVRARLSAGRR